MRQKTKRSKFYLSHEWSGKPKNLHAYTTLTGEDEIDEKTNFKDYGSFNLAAHVGDDAELVESNRQQLVHDLCLPVSPVWLDQTHGNNVFIANYTEQQSHKQCLPPQADSIYTNDKKVVCSVLTADCLPVFFCNKAGLEVAVAHAGWRGLHAGVLSKTIEGMESSPENIQAYLGPAIGPQSFEVGEEIFHAFVESNETNRVAFTESRKGHYFCDIYQLAYIEISSHGVEHIKGGDFCTFAESRFYSYRRQETTGRMANLIWLD